MLKVSTASVDASMQTLAKADRLEKTPPTIRYDSGLFIDAIHICDDRRQHPLWKLKCI